MSRAEEFLDLYKQLEETAIVSFNFPEDGSAVRRMSSMKMFENIKGELNYCRDVRNLLQHRRKISGQYAIEPSESMLQLLRSTIQQIENPVTLKQIAIPLRNALWKTPDDSVVNTMQQMGQQGFTYVPIISRGIVVGVFGQNTVFSYLLDHDEKLNCEMTFREIARYTQLEGRGSEIFRFLKPNVLKSDAEKMCENAYKNKKRVGMIFLTQNGKPDEQVTGVLTPWNILGS